MMAARLRELSAEAKALRVGLLQDASRDALREVLGAVDRADREVDALMHQEVCCALISSEGTARIDSALHSLRAQQKRLLRRVCEALLTRDAADAVQ